MLQQLNSQLTLQLTQTAPIAEKLQTLDLTAFEELQKSVKALQQDNMRLRDELELAQSKVAPSQLDE